MGDDSKRCGGCRKCRKWCGISLFTCHVLLLAIGATLLVLNLFKSPPVEDAALPDNTAKVAQSGDLDQDQIDNSVDSPEMNANADKTSHSGNAGQNQIDNGVEDPESTNSANGATALQPAGGNQGRVEVEPKAHTEETGDLTPSAKSGVSEQDGPAEAAQKKTDEKNTTADSTPKGSGENQFDLPTDLNPLKEPQPIQPSSNPTESTSGNQEAGSASGNQEDKNNDLNEKPELPNSDGEIKNQNEKQSISENPTATQQSGGANVSPNQTRDDLEVAKSKNSNIVLIVLGSVLGATTIGVIVALWCRKNRQTAAQNAENEAKVKMIPNAAKTSQQTRHTAGERQNGEYQFMAKGANVAQNDF